MNKKIIRESDLEKLENAAQRDSATIVELSKRHFWNNLIIVGFSMYTVLYSIFSQYPRREMIFVAMLTILIASGERFYIQRKIKRKLVDLTTFSMIIEFLKRRKNESSCNR
jgi:hypothetical protein